MVSEFRKKKYMHVFSTYFDSDKNGTVDKKDFFTANANFASLRGYKPGDVAYDLMKDLLLQIWDGLIAQADSDGDGVVNSEEWVQLWDQYSKNPAGAAQWQQLYCKCVFQFLDPTSDGSVDVEEYANVFASFGVDKAKSQEAFNKLAKGKSTITWDDFQALWKEYFCSDNPNDAGNYIFGVLN